MKKKYTKELIDTLNKVVEVVKQLRCEDDYYILEDNEEVVLEWIEALQTLEDDSDIEELISEMQDRIYYCFAEQLNESELEEKRVDLLAECINKALELESYLD